MQPFLSPLASSGVIQAGIVVQNLLGRNATMDFFITPNVCAIGTLRVGAVGLTIGDAILHGIQPTWGRATGLTKARYYPDAKEITVQLVGDSHQRLIGAQIISEEGVKERIDTLSVAIHRKMTARDLATTETCYAPPVSPLPDVLNTAAWNMVNKYPSIL